MTAKETDTIRTFVAVELSDSIKAHIAADIAQLRQEQIDNMRLVRPEGVHLTLKFLGDIDANRVPTVAEAMTQAAARHAPFSLALGQPGVFPNANRARVLWIGVEGDLQLLRLLQSDIEEALIATGFPPEKQRFNPHLTIGRMHHRASREDRRRATEALAALTLPEDRTIAVNAISLMKSTLLPGGAIYDRIVHTELSHGRA
ncbi:MAG: RNA 2',3'-cyclic phosphodiesterase [Chloroflexi bacterium]|nr:RNA 2',3'-cyclic phosphodiesterase [Chloroflexota bacterium]